MLNKIKQWLWEYVRVIIGGHIMVIGFIILMIGLGKIMFLDEKFENIVKFTKEHKKEIEYISKNILSGGKDISSFKDFEKRYGIKFYFALVDKKQKKLLDVNICDVDSCLDNINLGNAIYIFIGDDNEYCFILYSSGFYKKDGVLKNKTYYIASKFNNNLGIICNY